MVVDVGVQTEMVGAFVTATFHADGEQCAIATSEAVPLKPGYPPTTFELTTISVGGYYSDSICALPVETTLIHLELWERDQPGSLTGQHISYRALFER